MRADGKIEMKAKGEIMRADGKIEKITYGPGSRVTREWINPPAKKGSAKKIDKLEKVKKEK